MVQKWKKIVYYRSPYHFWETVFLVEQEMNRSADRHVETTGGSIVRLEFLAETANYRPKPFFSSG